MQDNVRHSLVSIKSAPIIASTRGEEGRKVLREKNQRVLQSCLTPVGAANKIIHPVLAQSVCWNSGLCGERQVKQSEVVFV